MRILKNVEPTRTYIGRLSHGVDLLTEITDICVTEKITLGRVEGLGAVQRARLGYYNQVAHEYQFMSYGRPLEITKLIGNVSLKNNKPFVHAHITLSDENGNVYGGHLAPGTIVFACEIILQAFSGPRLSRSLDDVTGLPLWQAES